MAYWHERGIFPALFVAIFLSLLFLVDPVFAREASTEPPSRQIDDAQSDDAPRLLVLDSVDKIFNLTSLNHATGFFPAAEGQSLGNLREDFATAKSATLYPEFKKNPRQWLYARVVNRTAEATWVLHVSHFYFQRIEVLARSSNAQTLFTHSAQSPAAQADTNAIGQGFRLRLQPGLKYLVAVELETGVKPLGAYIGLMSETLYKNWSTRLDYAFKLAIGLILGFVVLGLLFFALLRDYTFFWFAVCSFLLLAFYLQRSPLPGDLLLLPYALDDRIWLHLSLMHLSLILFAGSFLQIHKNSGRLYTFFLVTMGITFLVCILSPWLPRGSNPVLYSLSGMVVIAFILYSGMVKMRSQGRYYIIYMLGWLPIAISAGEFIVIALMRQSHATEIPLSYKAVHELYLQIAHMLIHAVAMVLRVQQIHKKMLHAEFLSRAKSSFIAANSHDLRQPLHTMRIFLGDLNNYVASPIGREILLGLRQSVDEMNSSFESIMDLSKLEANAVQVNKQPLALAPLFNKLQREYVVQAEANHTRLNIRPTTNWIASDALLLERLLRNLLSNAIKFSPGGRVLLGCRYRQRSLIIQVWDNGCGIPESDQALVFDVYRRAADSKHQPEGSGIGLSIVKHLSALLEHPIQMRSRPGKGSVFSVTLPLADPRRIPADQSYPKAMHLPIILCLSNATQGEYLLNLLSSWRYPVRLVASLRDLGQNFPAGKLQAAIVISDLASVVHFASSGNSAAELTAMSEELSVAAILCEDSATVPEVVRQSQWLLLSLPVQATQLRALLNLAARRVDTGNHQTGPDYA